MQHVDGRAEEAPREEEAQGSAAGAAARSEAAREAPREAQLEEAGATGGEAPLADRWARLYTSSGFLPMKWRASTRG